MNKAGKVAGRRRRWCRATGLTISLRPPGDALQTLDSAGPSRSCLRSLPWMPCAAPVWCARFVRRQPTYQRADPTWAPLYAGMTTAEQAVNDTSTGILKCSDITEKQLWSINPLSRTGPGRVTIMPCDSKGPTTPGSPETTYSPRPNSVPGNVSRGLPGLGIHRLPSNSVSSLREDSLDGLLLPFLTDLERIQILSLPGTRSAQTPDERFAHHPPTLPNRGHEGGWNPLQNQCRPEAVRKRDSGPTGPPGDHRATGRGKERQ